MLAANVVFVVVTITNIGCLVSTCFPQASASLIFYLSHEEQQKPHHTQ